MGYLLYIDPGTGTLLFQMLIAGFVTLIAFSRKVKLFIVNFFSHFFKK